MISEYIALALLLIGMTLFVVLLSACGSNQSYRNGTEAPDYREVAGRNVAYEVSADRDWVWEGFIEEIYNPDYDDLGAELTEAGCISDSITGRNVVGAVMDQFQFVHGNWASDNVQDAGLLAMVYVTVERDQPRPPVIRPVSANWAGGQVSFSLKTEVVGTQIAGAGWESLFASAGVSVSVSTSAAGRGWVEDEGGYLKPGYYETPAEFRGWHSTIAIEVYYLIDNGAQKETGRSGMAGTSYFYSEQKPSHDRLEAVARVLVDRMQDKAAR